MKNLLSVNKYFSEWERAGVTRFWVGLSNSFSQNSGECDMRLEDGGKT